jgi:hypothetical protein
MRHTFRILAIVEGHGEQTAVPVLLRRWFAHRRFRNFETLDLAIRAAGSGALKRPHNTRDELGIEYYVDLAASQKPDGILVMLDADDECEERSRTRRRGLGPELLARARATAPHIPIEVVVANREYEAWILWALTLPRRGTSLAQGPSLAPGTDIESIRDCKKRLSLLLERPYEETIDQLELTEALPFNQAMARRSRSYRKLLEALEALARAARRNRRHPAPRPITRRGR